MESVGVQGFVCRVMIQRVPDERLLTSPMLT